VRSDRFLQPGLVYLSGEADWKSYLVGTGEATFPGVEAIDPSDLNLPSIAIGSLAGSQTVTRSVTATTTGTYKASASVSGTSVTVSPSTLTFASIGETKTFTVR